MNREIIGANLTNTLKETDFDFLGRLYRGKVRDTYLNSDKLILIASDRISAFDHILKQTIPFKGQVLNKVAAYFFSTTGDIIANHIIDIPDPNVTIAKACKALPIEFVVRGYLAGHAWREYKAGKRVLCGEKLPDGLQKNSKLPHPILTPATKAEEGHDEDISKAEIIERAILDTEVLEELEHVSLSLFERGTEIASKKNLILVDTKYEFGLDFNGELTLIDEIHTPDSSRYFYQDSYQELLDKDLPQRQLSKEFVREWLISHNFQGLDGQILPDLPDSFVIDISQRYIELFEQLTGNPFQPELSIDPKARIEKALKSSGFIQAHPTSH